MTKVRGDFEVKGWDERTYAERDDAGKLTQASVTQDFHGDLEGAGSAEWLMCHRADGTARFVGLQHVDGTLGGRHGSFVLETSGDFDGQVARWSAVVVDGSGTGDLDGLRGTAEFEAPLGSRASFDLDYELGG
jgi:hypothetical protein